MMILPQTKPEPGRRIRGSQGQALRKRRLQNSPICEDCQTKGFIKEAEEVDHILPLSKGGTDTDDNVRCLCRECHLNRTAEQFNLKRRVTIGLDGFPID